MIFPRRSARLVPLPVLGLLLAATGWAADWGLGARVLVDKAGSGHRAVVLRAEDNRVFVAYEGVDERFDEWVDNTRVRSIKPPPIKTVIEDKPVEPEGPAIGPPRPPEPEPLPETLTLPEQDLKALTASVWLEQLPREELDEPLKFNIGVLPAPRFQPGPIVGLATAVAPLAAAVLQNRDDHRPGFASVENGIVIYRGDGEGGFSRADRLDTSAFGDFAIEFLAGLDANLDDRTDLVAVGGPIAQLFLQLPDGSFAPSAQPYRSQQPLRGLAVGRFFAGALPLGAAVIEGENTFRILSVSAGGLTAAGQAYEVKFDRIVALAAGDFDGDGLSDIAVTTESTGRSTGAWMYFNQHGLQTPFLWPIGGRENFARRVYTADLDRDGKDDLILTDGDALGGSRVRVVYGAGRAGWEDPWDLISGEFGLGFGTASVVTGDFNGDGRVDIGITGRNGLRIHLGGDYRRLGRNPVWPRVTDGDFPDNRAFIAADFDNDGKTDLLGFTPVFATGFNAELNKTPVLPPQVAHVPPPLKRRLPSQASTTVTTVLEPMADDPSGLPVMRHIASRAEPFGPYRYRLVVEIAVRSRRAIASVNAICKYHGETGLLLQTRAGCTRQNDDVWFVEAVLPRGRRYEFEITATDDKNNTTEPMRVAVNP